MRAVLGRRVMGGRELGVGRAAWEGRKRKWRRSKGREEIGPSHFSLEKN